MHVREIYNYKRMTASGMLTAIGGSTGGFTCTTGGTLQITVGESSGGSDILSSIAVVAGTFYPLGYYCPSGAYAVLGGGAVGTFLV